MAEATIVETGVGTHERVALDLAKFIFSTSSDVRGMTQDEIFRLYQKCLQATYGRYPKTPIA
ncbi:hypothetical protein LB534_15585 [Mesorhizobium sp. CA18]|uniref:hypothetical protein n=1 Tax=unclassified Mesorhizobium TaxID=325217 RepID=UPI001CCEBBB6|nr:MULTISPECIES: hypothetical protein [unclassified Mesorhizobium]MBZ9736035.1 hypothetical protein [Mesorhizobium sp. CA9]MBZ9826707.1 hypothetical protein [Mesorhizobium sp. CA18]MBZ9830935.1 hypothetical protein [Mesorhizobium sp. CA2]MBZ9835390.1 hypothetical protein [Mesorhizobium sp. CA3]MBZ9875926.1 hypothetical protein [Mesorhizobium sp. Ca11]